MQFKHPEILWALLLLLIPIIIHLFQLRRFKKTAFTNVKLLKVVKLQTRKSSQLKKWLILLTRLLAIACTVLAFTQPFITKSENFKAENETVIYLDNSFSMQIKGNNGSLLNEAIQDILKSYSEEDKITLFTNDKTYRNTSISNISNELIDLNHSTNQLDYNSVYLKGKQFFSKKTNSHKNLVFISDFQQTNSILAFEKDSSLFLKLVQLKPIYKNNISIDSLYINNNTTENTEIGVDLSYNGNLQNVSVALYNDQNLISKTAVDINNESQTSFTIPSNSVFRGRVSIEDAALKFDNDFFFNINTPEKIKVLSINQSDDGFLKKLYTQDEFIYSAYNYKNLDFSQLENQDLIILNEVKFLSKALIQALNSHQIDGGTIVIIPSNESDINSYNQLLKKVSLSDITNEFSTEKKITTINYDHPILNNVFYDRINNFQYPKVTKGYNLSRSSNTILSFEDNSPFLVGKDNTYLFAAPINIGNSNFKKSPLIVPILYNIGKKSLEVPRLYYHIGEQNNIEINTQLSKDNILTLNNGKEKIIPLQQTYSKRVKLTTTDFPSRAGIYEVKNNDETLNSISFNYKRDESQLSYYNLTDSNNYTVDNSAATAINYVKSIASINALWKWFVIFALVFLMIEMLILKYLK